MYTNKRKWPGGWGRVLQVLGPEFDSQVPHIILNIFSNTILCSNHPKFHRARPATACHVASGIHPVARRWSPWYSGVNEHAHDHESQQGLDFSWARIASVHLHMGHHTPFGLPCFILFSFLLILLIVLIIIINSPQINFP